MIFIFCMRFSDHIESFLIIIVDIKTFQLRLNAIQPIGMHCTIINTNVLQRFLVLAKEMHDF